MSTRTLYVIGATVSPVKIGITYDLRARLVSLQTGSPDPLLVHHAFAVHHLLAADIERACHAALAEHHRSGEWFSISADEAAQVIRPIAVRITEENTARVLAKPAYDEFEALGAVYDLHHRAAEAVSFYRRQLDKGAAAKPRILEMNRVILERAGLAALEVFKMTVISRTPLGYQVRRKPALLRQAEQAQVAALNALTEYYLAGRDKFLLDQILGKDA